MKDKELFRDQVALQIKLINKTFSDQNRKSTGSRKTEVENGFLKKSILMSLLIEY